MTEHHSRVTPGPARDLVVMVSSSGGVDALHAICGALPADFPAAIAIVQHRTAAHGHLLAELLSAWSPLAVRDASDGDPLVSGTIFIAPPDRHMTITADRTVQLVRGTPIHHVLSSADPLFESAAQVFGQHLTAVVLTGGDGDGAPGVVAVKLCGGMTIAQDPIGAFSGDMPRHAIATGAIDLVLPLESIADALVSRVRESVASGRERPVGSP
ncbi:MAG: CheB methylesterase [Gemmatimonadetes bacterium]|nr:CheB methylesterase [Gemmatimonadota bacterium]